MSLARIIFEGPIGTLKERLPDHPILENGLRGIARVAEGIGGLWYRNDFEDIRAFCLFVGHPRSGHSLVGALLDAHPEIVIAHELHALKYVKRGISREGLFFRLLLRSHWFRERGAEWAGYEYAVPSQHKGDFTTLKVIGDKKGSASSRLLREEPELLEELGKTVAVPVRVIRVIRHPLDNISTLARKGDAEFKGEGDLEGAIDTYFRRCETAKAIREQGADEDWLEWLEFAHEDVVHDSKDALSKICGFLGVSCTEDYLDDCAEVVFDTPHRSRDKVEYEAHHLEEIRQRMSSFPALDHYSLD